MAMGKRRPRQEELFVATADLAPSAGHPFYQALNRLQGRCIQFRDSTLFIVSTPEA